MMGKTKKVSLYAEIKEGLEEIVAIEKGQKKPAGVRHFSTSTDVKASPEEPDASRCGFAVVRRHARGNRKG